MTEELEIVVRRVRETRAFATLLGESPNFLKAIHLVSAIARHDGAALITGETGTGKELVARAIHYGSDRAAHPFVCVNCASLPDSLAEDALFGHESGAFTDARLARHGLFAEANRGTLFLDEIEAVSAKIQGALLRVLQDGTFHALGSARQQRSDVRIVAATNAPLDDLVRAGTFRADLYYRLRVFCVELPPLRERKGDVVLLANHFLRHHTPPDKKPMVLGDAAQATVAAYSWPGNVRELENAMLRAAVVCESGVIGVDDLGLPVVDGACRSPIGKSGPLSYQMWKRETIAAFERGYLTDLMAQHRGNVTHAARTAGKERRELGKLLKKHGVNPHEFRVA